ncbi:hypothetical protein [Ralstonia phage RP13]|nr:hypothetical protein [Ralstonia phage RP13]
MRTPPKYIPLRVIEKYSKVGGYLEAHPQGDLVRREEHDRIVAELMEKNRIYSNNWSKASKRVGKLMRIIANIRKQIDIGKIGKYAEDDNEVR